MRQVIRGAAAAGSRLEIRAGSGAGICTASARSAGRPVGLIASNPAQLSDATDADAADMAACFMQRCDAHGLPRVSTGDTPGLRVGPDTEATAQVRPVSRMCIAAAHLRLPIFAVLLRKGCGLGAMAMTGGGFYAPVFTMAWPRGEFGAMGLGGAVRRGERNEQPAVARNGAVIGRAQTRHRLTRGLKAVRVGHRASGGIHPSQGGRRSSGTWDDFGARGVRPVARLQSRVRRLVAESTAVGFVGGVVRT